MRPVRVSLALALTIMAGRAEAAAPAASPAPGAPAPASPPPATGAAPADGSALPDNPTFDQGSGAPKALLTLGMTKPTGEEEAEFSADELNTYFTAKLGGQVATKLYDDAASLGDALASGAIEAAWLTPPAYVRASAKGSIKPIVKLSRHGGTSYRSVFFVKAASKAAKLDDLTGLTMAWVSGGSASGNLYPHAYLKKAGKDPAKLFKNQLQLGDHSEVCKAVQDGTADVGATFADEVAGDAFIADGCREAGFDPKQFKVIAHSDSIPNDVIAVRADLPAAVQSHFQSALLEMAGSDKAKVDLGDIFHADGFGPSTDADFAPVREVVNNSDQK